jgi:diguanylate cyclase (GGDEF)-like protein
MDDQATDDQLRAPSADVTIVGGDAAIQAPERRHASLVVLSGWEIGRQLEAHGLAQILGRSTLVNTYIASPSVSRQHARIDLVCEDGEESFVLTDLGSSNGTFVNNQRIQRAVLSDGDKVRMGDVVFKFIVQDEMEVRYQQEVHQLIHYDQLTGLMKMEAFRRRLDAMLTRTEPCPPFVLSMTDLDGLKRVNDTHGHLAGRSVVRAMGEMMRGAIREQDCAGLYGGDEAIILYKDCSLQTACGIAEQLRVTVETRAFEQDGAPFAVTISQGLAEWPRHGKTPEELIATADRALYAAKERGRNRVVSADDL